MELKLKVFPYEMRRKAEAHRYMWQILAKY